MSFFFSKEKTTLCTRGNKKWWILNWQAVAQGQINNMQRGVEFSVFKTRKDYALMPFMVFALRKLSAGSRLNSLLCFFGAKLFLELCYVYTNF